ncbi:MAG: prolyl oligopeptidase family protein [Alphaproteobacteria bacterium]
MTRRFNTLKAALAGFFYGMGGVLVAPGVAVADDTDPFVWLEEVEGERALDWVRARNTESLGVLEADPRFAGFREDALDILTAQDRIPYGVYRGGHVYNFWQDETHVRGILRRTSLDSYRSDTPDWETVLDIDALAEEEGENWVYKGSTCLAPDYARCILTLSRGGKDAAVRREFDMTTKLFVEDGFVLPEAKTYLSWFDADHLLVGTDFGPGSLTTSGYPRMVKRWKRGTKIEDAVSLFEGEEDDFLVYSARFARPEGPASLIGRGISFFESEYFLVSESDGETLRKLPVPRHVEVDGLFNGQLLLLPKEDWEVGTQTIAKGSLVSMDLEAFKKTGTLPPLRSVYTPDARSALQAVDTTRSGVILTTLSNVTSVLKMAVFDGEVWETMDIDLPSNGSAGVAAALPDHDVVFLNYESFLVPDTLYQYTYESRFAPGTSSRISDQSVQKLEDLKQAPARFSAEGLVTRQFEATSKDGTKVPYFVVHREGIALDGTNPTRLYGYGGFLISLDPSYDSLVGKLWLERGGVNVIANIRGGGEFGPGWHEAALKLNRQRAYDDFAAVAEDLIARKITSPRRLGIIGGSNGGLLVGVAFTQRPDLYHGVVCAVPLLDMLRYHLLPPGASWIGEYGDPEIPEERAAIAAYSPYQNVRPDADYPKVFFVTSTKDDRVQPGHARKMAARMIAQGHDILYYENTEGGHAAGANLKQVARQRALEYVYFSRRLMDDTIEEKAEKKD